MKHTARVGRLEDAQRRRHGKTLIVVQALEPELAGRYHGQHGALYDDAQLDALAEKGMQIVKIVYSDDGMSSSDRPVKKITFDDIFAVGAETE